MEEREQTLVDKLFTSEDVAKVVSETNFAKAIGEDWFCGTLL